MKPEDQNPNQQETASNEDLPLSDEQLDGIAGGGKCYDDPREKDHSDKKDDPKEW